MMRLAAWVRKLIRSVSEWDEVSSTVEQLNSELANTREQLNSELANTREQLNSELANTRTLVKRNSRRLEAMTAREGFFAKQAKLSVEQLELLIETLSSDQVIGFHQAYHAYPVLRETIPAAIDPPTLVERRRLFLKSLTYRQDGPIFIIALPKCAGSWLSYILQDTTGFLKAGKTIIKDCAPCVAPPWQALHEHFTDLVELKDGTIKYFRQKPAIIHAHIPPTANNLDLISRDESKYVFLYRDLRDVIISLYYHLQVYSRDESELLSGLSTEKGITHVIDRYLEGLDEFVDGWRGFQTDPSFVFVRYEQIVSNPKSVIRTIHDHYGIELTEESARAVLARYEIRRTRKESDLISTDFKWRKGQSGEWRQYFTAEQKRKVKRVAGKLLIDLGYESDFDW